MNVFKKSTSLILIVSMFMLNVAFADEVFVGSAAASSQTKYTLDEMLKYAIEDEQLAQAEYQAIMSAFDVTRPFSNIYGAELKHEAALISLYESRGMAVPEFDATDYILIPDSLEAIYEIGIQAEINNIHMYEQFLEQDLDADVRLVFTALRDASLNHLNAFERTSSRLNSSTYSYKRQNRK